MTLANMVKIVLLSMAAQYMVVNTEPKNTPVNKTLSLLKRCFTYALGPWRSPNEMTNKNDPISQRKANLVGLRASTGKRKKLMKKQSKDAPKQQPNPTTLSNRLIWNHEGSCVALALVL